MAELRRQLSECDGRFVALACEDHGPQRTIWKGCDRPDCTCDGCQTRVMRQRRDRAWNQLRKAGDVAWSIAVLTIPEQLWPVLQDSGVFAKWRRQSWKIVASWAQTWQFGGRDVQLLGLSIGHPCGDAADKHWQPHFNIIWPTRGVFNGAWADLRYKVPKKALDDLRTRWSKHLESQGWTPDCQPEVKYQFCLRREKKLHALRYFLRGFPSYQVWTHRVVYYGLLAGSLRKTIPLVPADMRLPPIVEERVDPRYCQICGRLLHEIRGPP